jgi:hypothetical protein
MIDKTFEKDQIIFYYFLILKFMFQDCNMNEIKDIIKMFFLLLIDFNKKINNLSMEIVWSKTNIFIFKFIKFLFDLRVSYSLELDNILPKLFLSFFKVKNYFH